MARSQVPRSGLRGGGVTRVERGRTGTCPMCGKAIRKADEAHVTLPTAFTESAVRHLKCWQKSATIEQVPKILGGL